ncbi:hypothetical protein BG000_009071 [Podila horticola]|nr:hypothetical protein BG000_009071 [Podila horticola]
MLWAHRLGNVSSLNIFERQSSLRGSPYSIAPGSRTRTLSYADYIFSTQKLFISDGSLAVDGVLRRRESFYSLDPATRMALNKDGSTVFMFSDNKVQPYNIAKAEWSSVVNLTTVDMTCLTRPHGVVTSTVEHTNVRATVYSSERKSVFLLGFDRRLYEYNLTSKTYSTVIGLIDKKKNTSVLDPLG